MSATVSRRDRNVLVVGAVVCLVIIATAKGASWVAGWYARERAVAVELRRQLELARVSIAAKEINLASLASSSRVLDSLQRRVFANGTPHGTAAAAASHLTQVARTARVETSAVQLELDSTATGLTRRIVLVTSVRADISGLARLLAVLEGGQRLFRVAALSISQPDVVGDAEDPERLSVQLRLETLALRGSP